MTANIPKNLPDNEFVKALVAKYRTAIRKGDFKSIVWDRVNKEFIINR